MRLIGVLSILVLVASCARSVVGTATTAEGSPSPTASADDNAWIAETLPDAAELSHILGGQPLLEALEPLMGDVTDLRDTMAGSDVTEAQCVGAVSPLEARIFANSPVNAVAYATLPEGTFGAVALASPDDARGLFSTFADQWQQCNDKLVIKSDRTNTYENQISEVAANGNVLSATVLMTTSASGRLTLTQRALGVAANCIVDVELPVSDTSPRRPNVDGQAVQLVQLMLAKVGTVPR